MMDEREDGEISASDTEETSMSNVTSQAVPLELITQYRSRDSTSIVPRPTSTVVSRSKYTSSDSSSSEEDDDDDCHLRSIKKKKTSFPLRNDADMPAFSAADQLRLQSQFQLLQQSQQKHTNAPESQSQTTQSTSMRGARPRKRNNIWSNVLGVQSIEDEINNVGLKKLDGDRSVENYDYKAAQAALQAASKASRVIDELEEGEMHDDNIEQDDEDEMKEDNDEDEMKIDDNRTDEMKRNFSKRLSRKRPISQRMYRPPLPPPCPQAEAGAPLTLPELPSSTTISDEALVTLIAQNLQEQKPELIGRVVETVGKQKAVKLYEETCEVERSGGMLIVNGGRRRTSGGVFLQLVKRILTKEQIAVVFPPDEAHLLWRRRKRAAFRRKNRERHDSAKQTHQATAESAACEMAADNVLSLQTGGDSSCDIPDQLVAAGSKCPGSTPVTSPAPSPGPTPATTPVVTPHCSDGEESGSQQESRLVDTALAIVKAVSPTVAPLAQFDEDFADMSGPPAEEMDVY